MSENASTSPPPEGPAGFDRTSDGFIHSVLEDLGTSPTPYHAVERAQTLLVEAGFNTVDLSESFPEEPGGYLALNGGTLIAWLQGAVDDRPKTSFTIVGAHTDSPNFRVKSHPDVVSAGLAQIGLEVYGGVLVNSWLNRDLGLAGRVSLRADDGPSHVLIDIDEPIMTIPQLAIHLDRRVADKGLDLNKQQHLMPIWAINQEDSSATSEADSLRHFVGRRLDIDPGDILAWDLMPYDLQSPARFGRSLEFIASARIDNLLSSFCATRALARLATTAGADPHATPVLVLYDHEEIGSESATGAAGNLLLSVLERIAYAQGDDRGRFLTALAGSIAISADGAHATHPNYVDKHDPNHHIALNGGVTIKRNANQRYATDAVSESFIVAVCDQADVPLQYYIHRNDIPCGSTIGPITAARLGVSTVDLGAPQLSMHSVRETAGTTDAIYLADTLYRAWLADRCC